MKARKLQLARDGLVLSANLYGDSEGNSNKPLLVLLHGFPDTPHSWDELLPNFLAAGYQVLTPWLRGYTQGSAKRGASYDLLSVAADIDAWRRELKVEQAHLVGHDWGAAVANVLAGQQAGAQAGHCPHWQTISLLAVPPMPQVGQWLGLMPQLPKQALYSAYMPVMQLSASHRLLTRNNAAYVRRLWQRWSPGWQFSHNEFAPAQQVFTQPKLAWASTRYYRNLFRWYDPAVRQAFKLMQRPFNVPTLVLVGENDGCMHPQTHALIEQTRLSSAEFQMAVLPNCGHFLQAEQPQAVAEALIKHLRHAQK